MLSKIYYKTQDKREYEFEYQTRYNSPAAIHLDFLIGDNPAFYITTPEVAQTIESIYINIRKLESKLNTLPGVAKTCYFQTCLIDEIIMSNNIEHVYSTRKDITNVLDVLVNSPQNKLKMRLFGMVQKYNYIYQEKQVPLASINDIRSIYDDLILPEIENEDDKPDGALFRQNSVNIVSSTGKIKHTGLIGEEKISAALTQALKILNQDYNLLINIAIFHYLFGYIHPFYEGNGRLSRFISSYKLARLLHPLVANRLSFIIKNNQSLYYNAFDYCNDSKNRADLTPFIIIFLKMIKQSIASLMDKITEGQEKLTHYATVIAELNLPQNNEPMAMLLIQQALFAPEEPFTINDIALISEQSKQTCRKLITELTEKNLPVIISRDGHSNKYSIDLDELDKLIQTQSHS